MLFWMSTLLGARVLCMLVRRTKPGLPSEQFPVAPTVPNVHFVGHALDVALGVKGHRAEHRAHGIACAQRMRNSRAIHLTRAPDALRQRLHRRVVEQRKACRLVARRPKLVDDMFGGLRPIGLRGAGNTVPSPAEPAINQNSGVTKEDVVTIWNLAP